MLLLCICVILASMPAAFAATGDEVRAAKKIISVVYDDSGSMSGERWVYANYAMQALTALLNEQDELYITYMSQPRKTDKVNLTDVESSIKSIREWTQSGDTPGAAIDTAKRQLDSISEDDPASQFWLVIMTDGEIQDLGGSIQSKLDSFKNCKMSNQSALNVVYFAMGSGAKLASPDITDGLYTYSAKSNQDITKAMREIANLVSGRFEAKKITQLDGKRVSVTSDLPLYSIAVLAQDSSALVVDATATEGILKIAKNISLEAYEPFQNTSLTLKGSASVIGCAGTSGQSRIIPAGTYEIEFSEDVDLSDLVIQYEPAIELSLIITKEGIEVKDTNDLAVGDEVNVEIVPVLPGSGTRLDISTLTGVSWCVDYMVDNAVVDSSSSTKLLGTKLQLGANVFRGTMQIPGFAASVCQTSFTLEEVIYHFGIDVDQPKDLAYYRHDPSTSIEGGELKFWLTNDEVRLTKEEQKTIGTRLEVSSVQCDDSAVEGFWNRLGKLPASCKLQQNDDGSYTLRLDKPVIFSAFLMKAGVYQVTVCVDKDQAVTEVGTFEMIPTVKDWIELGGLLAVLLLLGHLVFVIFFKYKFKGQTVSYEMYRLLSDGTGSEINSAARAITLNPLSGGLLLPKRACEIRFNGVVLRAAPYGEIIVTGDSIAKKVHYYGASSGDPESALDMIVSGLRGTEQVNGKKVKRVATDQRLSANRPIYFRTGKTDRKIWRMRIYR